MPYGKADEKKHHRQTYDGIIYLPRRMYEIKITQHEKSYDEGHNRPHSYPYAFP